MCLHRFAVWELRSLPVGLMAFGVHVKKRSFWWNSTLETMPFQLKPRLFAESNQNELPDRAWEWFFLGVVMFTLVVLALVVLILGCTSATGCIRPGQDSDQQSERRVEIPAGGKLLGALFGRRRGVRFQCLRRRWYLRAVQSQSSLWWRWRNPGNGKGPHQQEGSCRRRTAQLPGRRQAGHERRSAR